MNRTFRSLTKEYNNKYIAEKLQHKKDLAEGKGINLSKLSFENQTNFILDKSSRIAVCCSRRSGKTHGVAFKLIMTALMGMQFDCLYVTKTRLIAKELLWDLLIDLLKICKVDFIPRLAELIIFFPRTKSKIYLRGAEDSAEIDKLLGHAYKLVVIDEAQAFPEYLERLCEEIITPALADLQGQLILTGTPNAFSFGYFYDCCHNDEWHLHHWTWKDNPFFINKALANNSKLQTADDILSELLKKSKKLITDPSVRRDFFGEWTKSMDLFVYNFDPKINGIDEFPKFDSTWKYVLGADLGFNDSSAIVVLGYPKHSRECYVVYQWKKNKLNIDQFSEKIEEVIAQYKPYYSVMDAGGGAALMVCKRLTNIMMERYKVPIHPAAKDKKVEYIKVVNSEFANGNIKILRKSPLVKEFMYHTWDPDKFNSHKYIENDATENHLCDAFLYAWRWAYNYLEKPRVNGPEVGSLEWQEKQMRNNAERISIGRAFGRPQERFINGVKF